MDEDYYKENFKEWTTSASSGRRFGPYLFELFLLLGIALLILFPNFKITGIAALLFSVYELIKYLRFRRRWMRDRISSNAYGREMIVELKNGEINLINSETDQIRFPISKARIIVYKSGFFIYPNEGLHLYVPFSSFSPPISRDEALRFLQTSYGLHPSASGEPQG
jgi:hypothetical protein